jgi:hypothetical protein
MRRSPSFPEDWIRDEFGGAVAMPRSKSRKRHSQGINVAGLRLHLRPHGNINRSPFQRIHRTECQPCKRSQKRANHYPFPPLEGQRIRLPLENIQPALWA